MNHIIAIASFIGGGKTSLVQKLASALNDSTTIHYDHYEKMTGESPDQLQHWLDNGGDFNELSIPGLSDDLDSLKAGKTIIDPSTRDEVGPGKYIIFEMPLGKEHIDTAVYIDWLIWIDVPLDLALARKIREFTALFLAEKVDLLNRVSWLDGFLNNYIKTIREVLIVQREKVKPKADMVLDGEEDLDILVRKSRESIIRHFP